MFRERFYISDNTIIAEQNKEVMRILDRRITSETIAQLHALKANNKEQNKFDPDKRI